ncbi:hypothetical protein GTP58_20080 [Duganella sp. CY15W]|uniref:replication-relaxation family protein n=1 Tax=Duganella sp. CY15W TaxID=2692172 RepID=UPI001369E608|nr:replication-relaxation family protein [Duganella sp. CY15W]MYM30635.1 hypothetical protein [Duganella sp. CY15W]
MKHIPLKTSAAKEKDYLAGHNLATKVGGRPSVRKTVPSGSPKQMDIALSHTGVVTSIVSSNTTMRSATGRSSNLNCRGERHSVQRGITIRIHPGDLQQQIAVEVLRCLARFRIIRAVDIAVYCFAERPYTAARQAARRALNGLLKRGCILSYRTERHQTIYAMTEAGKRFLEEYGFEGTASIRRAANMVNPNHTLWLDFITLACEARGLSAFTESEIIRALNPDVTNFNKMKKRGIVEVTPQPSANSSTASRRKIKLLPDAVALEDDGITWFEIDASRRGPARAARLMGLIRKIGAPVSELATAYSLPLEQSSLLRLSIHATNPSYFRLLRNRLMKEVRETKSIILTESDNNFRVVQVKNTKEEFDSGDCDECLPASNSDSYIFEIWRARDCATGLEDACVGQVILQLLPTWLPNYKGSDEEKSNPAGWFEQNYLPYHRPTSLGKWPMPVSQFPLNLKRL